MKYNITYSVVLSVYLCFSCVTLNSKNQQSNLGKELNSFVNPLLPIGSIGTEIKLAVDGTTNYVIVLPNAPSTMETKAALELKKYLELITSASFAVFTEKEVNAKKDDELLVVGKTELFQTNFKKPSISLEEEGYGIYQKKKMLFFIGGSRKGPLNAVFAFLEEDLGVRWYSKDIKSIKVPKSPNLSIVPVLREELPAFKVRELMYWDAFDEDWGLYNRMNATRMHKTTMKDDWGGYDQYPRGWSEHTHRRLIPEKEYFKSNPEYFSVRKSKNGNSYSSEQLCLTNSDILGLSMAKVNKVLSKVNPEFISISQNDGKYNYCKCDNCVKSNSKFGTTGTNMNFVNEIANTIKDKFPNTEVSTLAYYHTYEPSLVKPADNVFIELCTNKHWSSRYEPIRNDTLFKEVLSGWKEIGTKIHIWDYPVLYSKFLMPFPTTEIFSDNLKFYAENDIRGILFQGEYKRNGKSSSQNAMKTWVYSKLMWNPNRDVKLLIKDFIEGYYGSVSDEIFGIHKNTNLFIETFDGKINPSKPPFPKRMYLDFKPKFNEIYNKIESDMILTKRVQLFELPYLYLRLVNGPIDMTDNISYSEDLELFSDYCKDNNVTVLDEFNTKTGVEVFLLKCRIMLSKLVYKQDSSIDENLIFDESNMPFVRGGDSKNPSKEIIKNPYSSNGYSIKFNNFSKINNNLLAIVKNSALELGKTYKIKISISYNTKGKYKLRKNGNQSPSLGLDFRGLKNNENSFYKSIYLGVNNDDKFKIYDLGEFTFNGNGKIYLKISDFNFIEKLELDYIIFEELY